MIEITYQMSWAGSEMSTHAQVFETEGDMNTFVTGLIERQSEDQSFRWRMTAIKEVTSDSKEATPNE